MLAKWSAFTAGGVTGAALGVWLLHDWLWGTLFNYDNVPRDKQSALTLSALDRDGLDAEETRCLAVQTRRLSCSGCP